MRNLIDACAKLKAKQIDFTCDIIGDGPLRDELQTRINNLRLDSVTLRGALTQEQVFAALRNCDIFALASIIDQAGASDVFPTVIQEAMACARPVVSTRLAGIPETVVADKTGFLVPPGDISTLADALEKLLRSRDLRQQLGAAGRARIEEHFQIETTIEPLIALFESVHRKSAANTHQTTRDNGIGYLIDLWPDDRLPMLEKELLEMERRNIDLTAFVCRTDPETRFTPVMEQIAPRLKFLPDAMAIEAEWLANPELAHQLENDRATETHRAPADIFLQQARFALALRKLILQKKFRICTRRARAH